MNNSNATHRSRINKVIDYIDRHLDESVSLDILAKVACYSPFHFHRIFAAVTGETVNNFTNRCRNEKAARLLKYSNQTISTISIVCGFSSPATFSRAFQQYFNLSPTAYRNGGEIKNSKIRNELFPVDEYYCTEDDKILEARFPIDIRQLPERRIAYIRVSNAFKEGIVIGAFGKLIEWAKANNLYASETFFGMSKDDPEVTPKEKYSYDACITIPWGWQIEHHSLIETVILPKCTYAVTKVNGDMQLVGQGINYLFDKWLINSEYECEHLPGIELYLEKENICNWDHFNLELMIPVKKM